MKHQRLSSLSMANMCRKVHMCLNLGLFALNQGCFTLWCEASPTPASPTPLESGLVLALNWDLGVDGEKRVEGEGYNVAVFLIQL